MQGLCLCAAVLTYPLRYSYSERATTVKEGFGSFLLRTDAAYVYLAAGYYRIQMDGNVRQVQLDNCDGPCTWYPSSTTPLEVYYSTSFGVYVAAQGQWAVRFYRIG